VKTDQNRVFLAIVLSGFVLIGWQYFFAPKVKPGDIAQSTTQATQVSEPAKTNQAVVSQGTSDAQTSAPTEVAVANSEVYKLDFNSSSLSINSQGMISDIQAPNTVYPYKDIVGDEFKMSIGASSAQYKDRAFNFTNPTFNRETSSWTLTDESTSTVLRIQETEKFFNFIISGPTATKLSFFFSTTAKTSENKRPREYVYFDGSAQRYSIAKDHADEGKLKWFGLDFHYHLFAFVNDSQLYTYNLSESGAAKFSMLNEANEHSFKLVFVKKNYDLLSAIGDNVDQAVDFGFFGIVAVPILRVLQYLHRYIPNYGIAIIILTIIIRMLTFPLQFKSFKSMKKMQTIQPDIAKLKEKFKDDPQRMQKETMELFKRSGANPLGGCLPMILQMPIFIAFYQVLSNSVELVGAPFYFWLTDLSVKDHFYVLPVLMGIVMFFQSKLNPTPMTDPTQKKMMMFMPIVFTFIMKDLPSGLNLYMTVSITLGIAQQLLVYRLSE